MTCTPSSEESPEALRARAEWYREWAKIVTGDRNAWLQLADHFDRMAEERERARGK